MSNVSRCDGPPNWCRKMMCLARARKPPGEPRPAAARAGSARRCRRFPPGAGGGGRTGDRPVIRQPDSCLNPSPFEENDAPSHDRRIGRLRHGRLHYASLASMPEQELFAVDQCPDDIFPRFATIRCRPRWAITSRAFGSDSAVEPERPGRTRRESRHHCRPASRQCADPVRVAFQLTGGRSRR